jgi:PAS domain S-box-containing protein
MVALSVVLAIVISFVAMLLTFGLKGQTTSWSWRKSGSALVMGLAIPVMHYVGMAAVTFTPSASVHWDPAHAVNVSALALTGVGLVTFAVLGLVILISVADRQFSAQRQMLEAFLEHVPANVYFKDRESLFLRISRAMADYAGLEDPAQAVGRSDADIFRSEHASEALGDEQEIIRTGQSVVGKEEEEIWPDEHKTWVLTNKVPLRDSRGQIVGTMGISYDITARKIAERELALKAEQLARTNATLEQHISMHYERAPYLGRRLWATQPAGALPPRPQDLALWCLSRWRVFYEQIAEGDAVASQLRSVYCGGKRAASLR